MELKKDDSCSIQKSSSSFISSHSFFNCPWHRVQITEGYLVTYKDNDFINATDLKFLETDEKGIVICPLCKNKIDVSLTDLEEE